ncbi:MAG TPA: cytochrome c oxidase subunit 2A [Paenibacillaceae bacterium]
MANDVKRQPANGNGHEKEPALWGTFVAVLIMGSLFVAGWFGAFALFLERN